MKTKVYNQEGKELEALELPDEIFGLKIKIELINQAVTAQLANSRQNLAHAKDRSEVRGGGKKPWRQKGTGRARHGSNRSPIWVGGGVTHGPRKEKNFSKKINKQMKRQALLMVLSGKARDNEIVVLDDLKLTQPRTKEMAMIFENLKLKVKNDLSRGALLVMPGKDENIIRASRNLPKLATIGVQSLNVLDLLSFKYLLMPKKSVDVITEIYKK